jgi:hypothetical protein
VELLGGSAAGFDSVRNDGVADLTLGVSIDLEGCNLELSCRVANSVRLDPESDARDAFALPKHFVRDAIEKPDATLEVWRAELCNADEHLAKPCVR